MRIETITNIKGTADNNPPEGYDSWKDFWEKKTGLSATNCHKVFCDTGDMKIVGAHVMLEGYGNYWYIVPLCNSDNVSGGTFRAFGPFVPVNPNMPILK